MTHDTDSDPTAEDVQQLTTALHQQAEQVGEIAETQRALAEQQQRIMDLLEAVVARLDALDDQEQQDLEQRLADAVGDVLAPEDAGPVDPEDDGDPGRRMFR